MRFRQTVRECKLQLRPAHAGLLTDVILAASSDGLKTVLHPSCVYICIQDRCRLRYQGVIAADGRAGSDSGLDCTSPWTLRERSRECTFCCFIETETW